MESRMRVIRGRDIRSVGTGYHFSGHDFGYKLRNRYSTRKDAADRCWYEIHSAYGHNEWGGIGIREYEPTWYMLMRHWIDSNGWEWAIECEMYRGPESPRQVLKEMKARADTLQEIYNSLVGHIDIYEEAHAIGIDQGMKLVEREPS